MAEPGSPVNYAVKGGPQFYLPPSNKDAIEWRLGSMDAMGVDMEVLSINPFWYRKDRDVAVLAVPKRVDRQHFHVDAHRVHAAEAPLDRIFVAGRKVELRATFHRVIHRAARFGHFHGLREEEVWTRTI